jgi:hypothetical protein
MELLVILMYIIYVFVWDLNMRLIGRKRRDQSCNYLWKNLNIKFMNETNCSICNRLNIGKEYNFNNLHQNGVFVHMN